MKHSGRPARGLPRVLAAGVALLVVFLLVCSIVDEWRFSADRIGVFINEDETGILIEDVEPDLPAERAGLRAGDRLLAVEGTRVETIDELDLVTRPFRTSGRALAVEVQRGEQRLELAVKPGVPLDLAGLLAQIVLVAAYLGLAALAARYRHRDIRARLLTVFVTLVAVELALPPAYTFGPTAMMAIILFWLLATGVQFSLELHLVSLIPNRLACLRRRPRAVLGYYLVGVGSSLLLAGLTIRGWLRAEAGGDASLLYLLENTVLVGWAGSVALILAWQAWRAPPGRPTNQALIVLSGVLPWVAYIFVSTAWPGWASLDTRMAGLIESVVLLIFPASVFLAIFRYGLLDIETFTRRSLLYSIVAVLVVILLYALLTLFLPPLREWLGPNASQWLVTGLAVGIGVLFRPLRKGIEQLVERGLNPQRRALRHRLIRTAASLSAHVRLDALIGQLAESTRESLNLRWAAVVAIDGASDALHTAFSDGIGAAERERLIDAIDIRGGSFGQLESLRRPMTIGRLRRKDPARARELKDIGAEVLVPLFFQRRMIGILCLGSKVNGELFRKEEIELLSLFSHQVATSLENLRLFQDATYEALTGLLRREAVLRQLEAESARAVRKQTSLSVCMIDLDRFKSVNDSHGHLFGDRILARVAETMKSRIRAVDALGRFGGEEFLLVLPDTDAEGAHKLADSLRLAVSELRFRPPEGGPAVAVTVSIGLASADAGQTDTARLGAELLSRADAAVYRAKTGGRNRIIQQALKAPQP